MTEASPGSRPAAADRDPALAPAIPPQAVVATAADPAHPRRPRLRGAVVDADIWPEPKAGSPRSDTRPTSGEPAGTGSARRRPGDTVRLVLGAVVVAVAVGAHSGRAGDIEADLVRLVNDLPTTLFQPLDAVMQRITPAVVPAAALAALASRRVRLAGYLAAAGTVAWLLAASVEAAFPQPLAVAAALAATAGPHLPRVARRAAWAAVVLAGVAAVQVGGFLALDAVAGTALGWATAAALHLLLGTPAAAATAADVAGALRRLDLDPVEVHRAGGDARGSVPFVVRTDGGRPLFVKAVGRDQRDADLLFKAWRHMVFREVEDEAPFASVKQQVEHEAYLSMLAARAGVRTPAVLSVVPAGKGHYLLVQEYVAGRTLDGMAAEQVGDALLAGLWAELGRLRAAGIAHRDLRRANVLVTADGRPWLLDFGFAEAAASRRRLAQDVAELLASLAGLVGPIRAVRSAADTLGADAVAEALPLLQPAALAAATRAATPPDLLAELRERAAAAAEVDLPQPEPLTRVRPRTLLLVAAVGLAVHLLLPQVGRLDRTLHALEAVRWDWLALAVALSVSRYVAAAAVVLGAVKPTLAPGRTTLVQVASSFVDRLAPARPGGGVGVRYLERAGLDRSAAASAVAVATAARALVHAAGLLVAAILVSHAGLSPAHLPKDWALLVALSVTLALAGLALWSSPGRRRVLIVALRGGRELAGALGRPGKAALLLGGSVWVALSHALALACCLAAFGAHPGLAAAVAGYLAGTAVAAASPTPGGLVAMEAALVAGLTALGTPTGPAITGVLAFRLVTYWLPMLPGWLADRALRANGTL